MLFNAMTNAEAKGELLDILGPIPGKTSETFMNVFLVISTISVLLFFISPYWILLLILSLIIILVCWFDRFKYLNPNKTPYFHLEEVLQKNMHFDWWRIHPNDLWKQNRLALDWMIINNDKNILYFYWNAYRLGDIVKIRSFGNYGLAIHFKAGNNPVIEIFFLDVSRRERWRQLLVNHLRDKGFTKFREG